MPEATLTETIEQVIERRIFHGEGHRKASAPAVQGHSHIDGAGAQKRRLARQILSKTDPAVRALMMKPSSPLMRYGARHDDDCFGYRKYRSPIFVHIDYLRGVSLRRAAHRRAMHAPRSVVVHLPRGERCAFRVIGAGADLAHPPRQGVASQSTAPSRTRFVDRELIRLRPSFALEEGNDCTERFIRRPKENLLWPETDSCVEDLQ